MKKGVLLNAPLSAVVARLGHGDRVVVCDAGLPIPEGVERIDLAVCAGVPSLAQVLQALAAEMQVEQVLLAQETMAGRQATPDWLPAPWHDRVGALVPHATFKQQCAGARAVVRTGECTPYANVMLVAGVTF